MSRNQANPGTYILRSGLGLSPAQQKAIDDLLADLAGQLHAQFVLLVDVTGQVISTWGQQDQINLIPLGSLIAGDLAASREIARLSGQYQDCQLVLREGKTSHIFICEVSQHLALLVQLSAATPLGWSRRIILSAVQQLTSIATNPAAGPQYASGFDAEDLADLFGGVLDDLLLG